MLLLDKQEQLSCLDQVKQLGARSKIASIIAFVKRTLCK